MRGFQWPDDGSLEEISTPTLFVDGKVFSTWPSRPGVSNLMMWCLTFHKTRHAQKLATMGPITATLGAFTGYLAAKVQEPREGHRMILLIPGGWTLSMDWFKGKSTGNPWIFLWMIVVSCNFSLKPIQWAWGSHVSQSICIQCKSI